MENDDPNTKFVNGLELKKIEDSEDGSSVYQIGKDGNEDEFNKNLADDYSNGTLKKLSMYLTNCISDDIEARDEFLKVHNKMKKYLGYELEESDEESQALRTFDTTLSTCILDNCANATKELLPVTGPCSYRIIGAISDEIQELSNTRSQWLNYHLTVRDEGYYPDYRNFINYLFFYGLIVRKVYYDKNLKMPISRFIIPENFLFNTDCTSIEESNRLTHILKLSARDVLINQNNGTYRQVTLPYLKFIYESNRDSSVSTDSNSANSTKVYKESSLFEIYEMHVYLNISNFDSTPLADSEELSKPYIIHLDKTSNEILSIRRNWIKGDDSYKRIKYFVPYKYMSSFDVWGLGMARIGGSNAISSTIMLRQITDAAIYQNMPSGFIQTSTKQQQKDIMLTAGKFQPVDSLNEITTLPTPGPSMVLQQIRSEINQQMKEQLTSGDLGMFSSKEDINPLTAMAFLEESNKSQSSILRSIHDSFSEELRILDNIFREIIEEEEFYVDGQHNTITKDNFMDSVRITPVADPSVNSNVQRLLRAEAMFSTAMQMPDKINTFELLKQVLKAQGCDEETIDKLLIKENEVLPADPITENENLMQNKPVVAGIEQNHDAHILVHSLVENDAAAAHIQEHMALKFRLDMQRQMNIDLSTVEPDNMEMQNIIAIKAAEAVEQLKLNKGEDANDEINTNELLKAEIEQKHEHSLIQKEIAEKRLEGEIFKSQLNFEANKEKLNTERELALLKLQQIKSRIGINDNAF